MHEEDGKVVDDEKKAELLLNSDMASISLHKGKVAQPNNHCTHEKLRLSLFKISEDVKGKQSYSE